MPYYPERRPDPVPAQQKPRPAQQRKKLLCLFLAVLACALVVWGAVGLIRYFSDLSASRQTAAELRSIYDQPVPVTEAPAADLTAVPVPPTAVPATEVPIPAETPVPADYGLLPAIPYPYNSSLRISDRFTDLRRKGKYITGWLRMDSVDEPVVLKDNSYFLTRDATGKKNVNGAIFMDAGTRLETRPYTVILYGHNMKSGSMFGRLRKYRDGDYLVFGCETRGLPENLLRKVYDRCIRIPMRGEARSLNLANSAAIVLYEALRQNGFPGLNAEGSLTGREETDNPWLDYV